MSPRRSIYKKEVGVDEPWLNEVQSFLDGAAFFLNFLLQQRNGIDELLRTRRTAWNINIDGNDLIDALHQGVVLEDATRSGAGAHGHYPLGLRHLLP